MKLKSILYPLFAAMCVFTLAFAGWKPVYAQSQLNGWFTILWGDGPSASQGATQVYMLTQDNGQTTPLLLDESLAAPFGGVLALDRQRVTITGLAAESSQSAIQVNSIMLDDSVGAQEANAEAVTGSQPFISIMCKFSGVAAEPKSLAYFQNMYSHTYPGLDHYWRQVSYDVANIAGSSAVGWYTLPQPKSYYVYDQNGDGTPDLNHGRAAEDCTHVADATVDFTPFKGINLMFNTELDGFAWGGGHCMSLDGVFKCWPVTWEPPWGYGSIAVLSHEMGHAFGLPHSSGQYGQTYDNQWDVMSDTWTNCSSSTDPTYGCLGQHTISYHKNKLGWISPAQKFTANGNATITLEQLALPQTGNYLMAQIPINGSSTHFYTVEVRRKTGYDVKLPGQAVIIHEVNTTRANHANVIDFDGNGNTGDAGAMWTVGETFSDAPHGITVTVVSATATGFRVAIHSPLNQTTSVFRASGANDGWVLESGKNSSKGGSLNATATTFNLGDAVGDKQYRAVLHFDTSNLPDTAVITKVTLKIMKQGLAGTNPFTTHGALRADIREPFLGGKATLENADFQAGVSNVGVATFGTTPAANWYSAVLSNVGKSFLNRAGPTQFRLYFTKGDNNDNGADYMKFYSGNAPSGNRPQLIVQYYVP